MTRFIRVFFFLSLFMLNGCSVSVLAHVKEVIIADMDDLGHEPESEMFSFQSSHLDYKEANRVLLLGDKYNAAIYFHFFCDAMALGGFFILIPPPPYIPASFLVKEKRPLLCNDSSMALLEITMVSHYEDTRTLRDVIGKIDEKEIYLSDSTGNKIFPMRFLFEEADAKKQSPGRYLLCFPIDYTLLDNYMLTLEGIYDKSGRKINILPKRLHFRDIWGFGFGYLS